MLNIGEFVYLVNNPLKIGKVVDGPRKDSRGLNFYCVKFEVGNPEWKKEKYLKIQEIEEQYDLPSLISKNIFNNHRYINRALTQVRLSGNLSNMIYSMESTNTDFYAYQFKPVLKIINSASNSILIADEVGLGKTIEAGLIWTELRQRFNFKRILIICPGMLREKWKNELSKKFGVKAEILRAKDILNRIRNEDDYSFICSIQGISTEENEELIKEIIEVETNLIDLLILDEAHYIRNPETRSHKVIKSVCELADYKVFLSATPIQNKNDDLFSLVNILDPMNFPYPDYFQKVLSSNKLLVKLRDDLLKTTMTNQEILERLIEIRKYDRYGIFSDNKQFLSLMQKLKRKNRDVTLEQLHKFAYELEEINSLGYIYSRTRKRDVQEFRTKREPIREEVVMSEAENDLYNKITNSVRIYAASKHIRGFEAFLLCMPQRMLSSSLYATLVHWRNKQENIEYEDLDNLNDARISDFMETIYSEIKNYKSDKELYLNDTKYNRLRTMLKEIMKQNDNEKIVVFSSFVGTLEYLNERLREDRIDSVLLTGKSMDKDEALSIFENDKDKKVLLASEVGSEGVDLQFCRLLINYDLPWNPMRVEQRIGRLDRLGQKSPKITIWNMFHDSSIDQKIYDKLYDKLNICTSALGDFEDVLGDIIKKFTLDILSVTKEDEDKMIEQTKRAIEEVKVNTEKLEESASQFTAYGDYILQEIQKNRETGIDAEELAIFTIEFLSTIYGDIDIKNIKDNVYSLKFSSRFRNDFSYYCETEKISMRHKFLTEYGNILCQFSNNVTQKNNNYEIINQFHPLIKFLCNKIGKETSAQTSAIKIEGEDKGVYLLGVSRIFAKGILKQEKLIYNGFNVETGKILSPSIAENMFIRAIRNGQDWEDRNNIDYQYLGDLAFNIVAKNNEIYEQEIESIKNKNIDRANMQIKNINWHLVAKRNRLKEKIDYYERLNQNEDDEKKIKKNKNTIASMQGKYEKLSNRLQDSIDKIEESKDIEPDNKDLCMILLRIE